MRPDARRLQGPPRGPHRQRVPAVDHREDQQGRTACRGLSRCRSGGGPKSLDCRSQAGPVRRRRLSGPTPDRTDQSTASGSTGEPVAPGIRNGATKNRNAHRSSRDTRRRVPSARGCRAGGRPWPPGSTDGSAGASRCRRCGGAGRRLRHCPRRRRPARTATSRSAGPDRRGRPRPGSARPGRPAGRRGR